MRPFFIMILFSSFLLPEVGKIFSTDFLGKNMFFCPFLFSKSQLKMLSLQVLFFFSKMTEI